MTATRVAVCLITCDRPDYTRQTVESFRDMNAGNEMERFELLHADDASQGPENFKHALDAGFVSAVIHNARRGVTATIRNAVEAAYTRGHTHVLVLENDWVSHRPFPWELFDYFDAVKVAYCLRLTGQFKEWDEDKNVGRRPFGNDHAGRGKAPVAWCPLIDAPEPAEMGSIHFGNPPTVARIAPLMWLLDGPKSEAEVRQRSGLLEVGSDYTIRPAFNVFFHIGAKRTPQFKR